VSIEIGREEGFLRREEKKRVRIETGREEDQRWKRMEKDKREDQRAGKRRE